MADPTATQPAQSTANAEQPDDAGAGLSAKLVREVTQKVYALLVRDLKIEQERLGRLGRATDRIYNARRRS